MVESLIREVTLNETHAKRVRQLVRVHALTEIQVEANVKRAKLATCGDAWYTRDNEGPTVIQRSPLNNALDPLTGSTQDRQGIFPWGRPTNKSKFIYENRQPNLTYDDIVQDKALPGDLRVMDCSWYSANGIYPVSNPHVDP